MDPTGLLRQEKFGSILGSMKQRHDDPQFKFRMPIEMKARLEQAAKQHGRTLTSEILQRLEWSLEEKCSEPTNAMLSGQKDSEAFFSTIAATEKAADAEYMVLKELRREGSRLDLSDQDKRSLIRFQQYKVFQLRRKIKDLREQFVDEKIREWRTNAPDNWELLYDDIAEFDSSQSDETRGS